MLTGPAFDQVVAKFMPTAGPLSSTTGGLRSTSNDMLISVVSWLPATSTIGVPVGLSVNWYDPVAAVSGLRSSTST